MEYIYVKLDNEKSSIFFYQITPNSFNEISVNFYTFY